jgi:23S rRNA pseudouridine1911/1915/1917 synthase
MASGQERLDRYLVRTGKAGSRRAADELIANGLVTVNGHRPSKGDIVSPDDAIEVAKPARAEIAIAPDESTAIPLEVLYVDAAVIVVNKPGNVPCHPLRAGEIGTVMNAVVERFPDTATAGPKAVEGGLVHRLDNGTSGALIIARTREAHASLHAAIRGGTVSRTYRALVAGKLDRMLTLDAPIAHHAKNPGRMTIGSADSLDRKRAGRPAMSIVQPERRVGKYTLVKITPRTGSRHQIRVHLADAGHPIVGDILYGGPVSDSFERGRFWLHLCRVGFESPASGPIAVEAPLPPELQSLIS